MALIVHAIDLSGYRARLEALGSGGLRAALQDIGEAARHKWLRLAQAELHTTLADYVFGLQPVETEGDGVAIALVGMVPNLVEQGMDQVDLHTTLLGPNVPLVPRGQRGKHWGRLLTVYRVIPFRHATPGSEGLVAQRMGDLHARGSGAQRGREIGEAIYKLAKKLEGTTSGFAAGPTGAAIGGGRIPGASLGARFGLAERRWGGRLDAARAEAIAPKLANSVTGKEHAASIYAGMYRFSKTYAKATQSSYGTFRTISTAPSSQQKWIRPKTAGKNYARRVAEHIGPLAREILVALLSGAGGEWSP